MGHLINPIGFRVGVLDNIWIDSWFFKRLYYSKFLHDVKFIKEFIDFFFWDTKLKYKYIHSYTEVLKQPNKIILNLYGYDSKLESLIDKKMKSFFFFRKRQESKFFSLFSTFNDLNSLGYFFKDFFFKHLKISKKKSLLIGEFISSFYFNRWFYLTWKIFVFSIFLKWRFKFGLRKWLLFSYFSKFSKKKLNRKKIKRKIFNFYFKLNKANNKFNNLLVFFNLYNWNLLDFFTLKSNKASLKFFSFYKCKWFLKFFYFISVLINLTGSNINRILKLQSLYSLRLKNFIRSKRRFSLLDFYLDPILYPIFRQALLLHGSSVFNYNVYSKFFSLIISFALSINLDVNIFSLDNSQIDSYFLAQFISIKFYQGFYIWDILNPIFKELNYFKKYSRLLGYKIIINGRLSRRSKSLKRVYFKGKMPLNTFYSKIDYFFTSTHLKNGSIGIKIWLNKPFSWRGSYIKLN